MSLNLGNATMAACAALRTDASFAALRAGLADVAHQKIHAALDVPPEQRVEATSYARALRDVWLAIEAATLTVPQRQVALPKTRPGQPNPPGPPGAPSQPGAPGA